ncbi:MAG: hypothetical protein V7L20_26660 [Nostoc sp.]
MATPAADIATVKGEYAIAGSAILVDAITREWAGTPLRQPVIYIKTSY